MGTVSKIDRTFNSNNTQMMYILVHLQASSEPPLPKVTNT